MAVYKGIIKYLTEFFKSVQEAESLYCTPIAYIILCSKYTSIKKKKTKHMHLKKKRWSKGGQIFPYLGTAFYFGFPLTDRISSCCYCLTVI